MKKIKLINIIAPIIGFGAIAPALALSSCKIDNKKEETQAKLVKLNTSKTTNLSDPVSLKTGPMYCYVNHESITAKVHFEKMGNFTASIYYDVGERKGDQITWANSYKELATAIEIDYRHPVRFAAQNITNKGSFSTSTTDNGHFVFSNEFGSREEGITIGGTALSLLLSSDSVIENPNTWKAYTELQTDYTFYALFSYQGSGNVLREVSPNFLPFTTLTAHCYEGMFSGCDHLKSAPILPATKLTPYCYQSMFYGCADLTTAPHLPAKTIVECCYKQMFKGCGKLSLISMDYLGNFKGIGNDPSKQDQNEWFSPWVEKQMAEGGIVHYSGLDTTERGIDSLPFNATIISNPEAWLNENTKVIEIYDDSTLSGSKTTIISDNRYNKFRAYKDQTWLDVKQQIPTITKTSGEITQEIQWYNKDTNEKVVITDDTKINAIPNKLCARISYDIPESDTHVTLVCKSKTKITFKKTTDESPTISYSTNSGSTWTDLTDIPSYGISKDFEAKTGIWLKGNIGQGGNNKLATIKIEIIEETGKESQLVEIKGNAMALVRNKEVQRGSTDSNFTTSETHAFEELFKGSTGIGTVSKDFLPSSIVPDFGYFSMFENCSNLTSAPNLPAETIGQAAYPYMFAGCTSLITGPEELPATTLPDYITVGENYFFGVYEGMFDGCTSLTKAPSKLPATQLSRSCYIWMFRNCSSLKYAPQLSFTSMPGNDAEILIIANTGEYLDGDPAGSCYEMFKGCTALTGQYMDYTDPQNPVAQPLVLAPTELHEGCYLGMFDGCKSLTYAPDLPAQKLDFHCYERMFYGCSLLTKAPIINNGEACTLTKKSKYCYDEPKGKHEPKQPKYLEVNAYATCQSMFEGCTSLLVTTSGTKFFTMWKYTLNTDKVPSDMFTNTKNHRKQYNPNWNTSYYF